MSLRSIKAELESRQVFKAWEIEENLDRYFCRPVAVIFTAAFLPLRITPNQVSVGGMLIGMASAFFLFGPSYAALVLAVALLWLSEILDAADGQLARLAREPSRYGRIVDGLCSMGLFIVVYGALAAGLYARTGRLRYPVLALVAALTHSLQSSLYDFYRTEYIRIVKKREASDPDSPETLAHAQREHGGRQPLGRRLMLMLYHHYATRQLWTTPTYQPLAASIARRFESQPVSEDFARKYGEEQRKMVRWWNYLGSNTHLLALSGAILVRRPQWYLWGTAMAFSLYAVLITWAQGFSSRRLMRELNREAEAPVAKSGHPAPDGAVA